MSQTPNTSPSTACSLDISSLKELYLSMLRIRLFEESIAERYGVTQKMRCPTHLSIGQEAVAVGVSSALSNSDKVVSSHRAHAHYLAKGGDAQKLLSEIYGKQTGCCEGRGGSMHLIDESCGFMGSTAIVANSIPLAAGLALSEKNRHSGNIACTYFGEAATEEGVFYETLNFAALQNLPCLFICENNGYSVYTPLDERVPKERSLKEICEGLGVDYGSADGNDVEDVFKLATTSISSIKKKPRPVLLEFSTYRYREHCGPNYDDDLNYRPEAEVEYWKQRDCISVAQKKLLSKSEVSIPDIDNLKNEITSWCDELHNQAEAAPFPKPDSFLEGVYFND